MLGFTSFNPTLYLRGMLEEVVEPKSLNPNMAFATLRYQTKSSPKSQQTIIKQHPVRGAWR